MTYSVSLFSIPATPGSAGFPVDLTLASRQGESAIELQILVAAWEFHFVPMDQQMRRGITILVGIIELVKHEKAFVQWGQKKNVQNPGNPLVA